MMQIKIYNASNIVQGNFQDNLAEIAAFFSSHFSTK
jgi:hypothetical protein